MTDNEPYKKKLIEVALPLDAISAATAREKTIKVGKPTSVHHWWARRPLVACRAVLFAQLVDDPLGHPGRFPTEDAQDTERRRLFGIIERLVKWENSTNEDVLEEARAEIRKSCDGNPPPMLDPFAGGGSIPLEAQRLGLEAHASDLNPVAVLINKALIEIPPKWADWPPVHPDADKRLRWQGAEGLAEDVRRFGQWMRDEAENRIGHLYPKATLPDGTRANVIAWIWARTVTCPNPGCGATVPLAAGFWLRKKKGKQAWIRPLVDGGAVRFEIGSGPAGPEVDGTVGRTGATCLCCQSAVPLEHVRVEGRAGRLGAQLMAVVAEGDRQRAYLPPAAEHEAAALIPAPEGHPVSALPERALSIRVQAYGMDEHWKLFTPRQLTALITLSDLVINARSELITQGSMRGMSHNEATAYADAVAVYLALAVSRVADWNNSLSRWEPNAQVPQQLFARHAIPMVWDYSEAAPLGEATGSFVAATRNIERALTTVPTGVQGTARAADAMQLPGVVGVVTTDPPYYDNIGYADLSDFFYIWLRRSLGAIVPEVFSTILTPKSNELIASPYRHGGSREGAEKFFEEGFVEVFRVAASHSTPKFPLTFFYAFKQSEDADDHGLGSTGWSTMLEGLGAAGWMVTATWPLRTEMGSRMIGQGTNALASSVVLACRPRPATAGVTDRQGLVRALQRELPGPLRELQKAHIAPVDLRQAAIGPGMAVFSRFAKVIEPHGSTMRVRTALGLINQVLDQVLGEQESEFDAETRWAIHWFSQYFGDEGPYGVAEQLAVSMNVAVSKLVASGVVAAGGGKVRLLGRDELPHDWDPTRDLRTPVWEATQHLVKRLEEDGEGATARLLRKLGGLGESAALLAYRLYTVCEKARPALAGPYNALVASWPELQRLSREATEPVAAPVQQTFDA